MNAHCLGNVAISVMISCIGHLHVSVADSYIIDPYCKILRQENAWYILIIITEAHFMKHLI